MEKEEKELSPAEIAKNFAPFIQYDKYNVSIKLAIRTMKFYEDVDNLDVLRYLKSQFTNIKRFESRFIKLFRNIKLGTVDFDPTVDLKKLFSCDEVLDELMENYDKVEPFTYAEAFHIKNAEFQAKVFGSIDIVEMIKELGHERIAVEGKHLRHKQFSKEGDYEGYVEYDVIYETHKVDGTRLGLTEPVYALRCWCTTTDKEHWLWIEDEYKDCPLDAVASTFRVHAGIIPHITEIKRQGDILLVELDSEITPSDDDEIIPLTSEQYFSFLTAQS